MNDFQVEPDQVLKADIVVVGAGLAGLSACIEASRLNKALQIILLEKEPKLGGNSAKASSGINCAISSDDHSVFAKDTLKSGGGLSEEKLVQVFVDQSPSGIEFLREHDIDLSVLSQLGGHSCKRTHRNKSGPNVGFAITSTLQKKLNDYPNVQVITSAIAEQILHKEADPEHPKGGIRGLEVKKDDRTFIIETPVVIMATGGFSANKALLQRFAPGMENFPTTNGPWALGEGVQLAEQLGADLVHMDKVQLHPTGFINPKDRNARQRFLAPEAIRGSGAILLNVNGKRFVNELQTRDVVSQAILAQPEHRANMLLFEGATALESALGFYKHIGIVKEVHSVAEAAEYFGLDAQALLEELNQYADVAQHPDTKQDLFGKTVFPFPLKPIASVDEPVSIHVMEIEPAVHYTMGGVKINENAQVLKFNGDVIEGLFAAGEVSGGLHGANRLGGNSLAECVVFGRIAARQAVEKVAAVVAL